MWPKVRTFRWPRTRTFGWPLTTEDEISDSILWSLSRLKLVIEGAAAATLAAVRKGAIHAPPRSRVVCVLSGGNLDTDQFKSLRVN